MNFRTRPDDRNNLLYWHQRFFETLDASALNSHDVSVLEEAERLGKEVHIYNQGRDRYSFGLYQWSSHSKGIKARLQWHLNILHGYQFFDLDGREPDSAMIVYTSRGIYPTIAFQRCRQGAQDFYLYQTLARHIEANTRAGRKPAETLVASAMLRAMTDAIALNQRRPPEDHDPEANKLRLIEAIRGIR